MNNFFEAAKAVGKHLKSAVLVVAIALTSCNAEELQELQEQQPKSSVTVEYLAPLADKDYDVKNLLVVFFKPNGGEYIGYSQDLSVTSRKVSIELPDAMNRTSTCDLLVLGNCLSGGYSFPNGATLEEYMQQVCKGKSLEEVSRSLTIKAPVQGIQEGNMLFYGISKNQSLANIKVPVTRAISRLSLYIGETVKSFEFESLWVYNAASTVKPFMWIEGHEEQQGRCNLPKAYQIVNREIQENVYFFPSYVASPSATDTQTTCLIVKGRYNGSPSSYYRINLVDRELGNTAQLLPTNAIYYVHIKSITNNGCATIDEAYKSVSPLGIEVDQNQPIIDL